MRPFLLIVLFWLLIKPSILVAMPADMTIIYSGNLEGVLEPCGCTLEGDLGGLKRRGTIIDELRKTSPQLFLLSSGGLIVSYASTDRLTSEYILKGFDVLDYDAIGVQWKDLSYGTEFIQTARLPLVTSNWQGDEFSSYKLIEHGDRRLAFFSWLDPAAESQIMSSASAFQKRTMASTGILESNLAKAKSKNALTVLATTLDYETALATMPLKLVDILIIKSAYEKHAEPRMLDDTLVLDPGSRGMRLGRLDISLDMDNHIKSFKHQQIPMSPSVIDSPKMKEWYAEYNDRVKQAYLKSAEIRKDVESGKRNYVGADACKKCHLSAYTIWSKSQHAKAFNSLALVNKAFDPGCIVCHSAGFNKEGGYIDYEATAHLTDVQCESCHGAAREHVASNGKTPPEHHQWPKEKICNQCHIQKHSPSFKIDSYWLRVLH